MISIDHPASKRRFVTFFSALDGSETFLSCGGPLISSERVDLTLDRIINSGFISILVVVEYDTDFYTLFNCHRWATLSVLALYLASRASRSLYGRGRGLVMDLLGSPCVCLRGIIVGYVYCLLMSLLSVDRGA